MWQYIVSFVFVTLFLIVSAPAADAQRQPVCRRSDGQIAPVHMCEQRRERPDNSRRRDDRRFDDYRQRGDFGRGEGGSGGGSYGGRESFNCDGPRWYCEQALQDERGRRDETLFVVDRNRGCDITWRHEVPDHVRARHLRQAQDLQRQCRGGNDRRYNDRRHDDRRGSGGAGGVILGVIIGAAVCSAIEC